MTMNGVMAVILRYLSEFGAYFKKACTVVIRE